MVPLLIEQTLSSILAPPTRLLSIRYSFQQFRSVDDWKWSLFNIFGMIIIITYDVYWPVPNSNFRSWWPRTSSFLREICWHTGNLPLTIFLFLLFSTISLGSCSWQSSTRVKQQHWAYTFGRSLTHVSRQNSLVVHSERFSLIFVAKCCYLLLILRLLSWLMLCSASTTRSRPRSSS